MGIGDAGLSDMHTMHAFDLGQLPRSSKRLECPQHQPVEFRQNRQTGNGTYLRLKATVIQAAGRDPDVTMVVDFLDSIPWVRQRCIHAPLLRPASE